MKRSFFIFTTVIMLMMASAMGKQSEVHYLSSMKTTMQTQCRIDTSGLNLSEKYCKRDTVPPRKWHPAEKCY